MDIRPTALSFESANESGCGSRCRGHRGIEGQVVELKQLVHPASKMRLKVEVGVEAGAGCRGTEAVEGSARFW